MSKDQWIAEVASIGQAFLDEQINEDEARERMREMGMFEADIDQEIAECLEAME